jgi:uncharacterized membrane protein
MHYWVSAAPAISAAFLASFVEVVEAFTVVLAVSTVAGWRPASLGTAAALLALSGLVIVLGPALSLIPLHIVQFAIGVLLLLFGLRWLRKSILRSAGVVASRDESIAFDEERQVLERQAFEERKRQQWLAGIAAFKAVILEGLEVIFIVIAVGAGSGLLWPASLGAMLACFGVFLVGIVVHKPLSRVPENWLKFAVGTMLSAFGLFWTGEGLGVSWLLGEFTILVFAVGLCTIGLVLAHLVHLRFLGAAQ